MSRKKKTTNKQQDRKDFKSDDKRTCVDESKGKEPAKTNDPFWYGQSPELLRDAASVPWVAAAGTRQSLSTSLHPDGDDHVEHEGVDYTIRQKSQLNQSGVQIIKLAPTIGQADEANSPVNIAANAVYTWTRFQNSGHANYDAPDLMLYCLAMSEIYSFLNWCIRIYGIASLFTQRNRFVPEKLLAAEGISYPSIRDHMASFRYGINLLITKAASLCVPANFTLFLRRAFVYQGVYTEGTSMKDQLYMYSPDGFYKYALDDDGAGMLQYETKFGRLAEEMDVKYNELLDYGNSLLDAIIQSEDCQIMSGDILKAYGDGGVLKLGTLAPDYTVVPTFDIAVLEQMKNATIYPGYVNGNDITQDPSKGFLTCDPCVALRDLDPQRLPKYFATAPLLTTSTNDPGPEVTMENSRLTCPIKEIDPVETISGQYWYPLHLWTGTEIPVDIVNLVWLFEDDEVSIRYPLRYSAYYAGSYHDDMFARPDDMGLFETLATRNNFKFAPGLWVVHQTVDADDPTLTHSFTTYTVDLDNFTIQSVDVIRNMHETAIMSELATPAINKL